MHLHACATDGHLRAGWSRPGLRRDADPRILPPRIQNSVFHSNTVVERSTGQPSTSLKLVDAARDKTLPFSGPGLIGTPRLEALRRGERPAIMPRDSGCDTELIERFLEFTGKR